MNDDQRNIILGGLALFFGVMVFGWAGGQEIWTQGKFIDGVINILIGALLSNWGLKKLNEEIVFTVKRRKKHGKKV